MFLSVCNEVLGLSPNEILDSDFVLLSNILKERNHTVNQRNKQSLGDEAESDSDEYVEITDFETGKKKRVKRVKSI